MNKVAAIQMNSSESILENLTVAKSLIKEAASNGAKLIVLPEMFPVMGRNATDKVKAKEDMGIGQIQSFISEQASRYNVWIVAGTIPITSSIPHKVRAACIVYNDKGETVARYDKIHLFDVEISENETYQESKTTDPGNELTVIDTPVGKLGIAVCYDIRFPNMFTRLFNKGAEIIAIPSAFTVKTGEAHWKLLARSRAVENFSYVIGACQTGKHVSGRETYGNSLIIDPWGTVLDERIEPTAGIVYAKVDLTKLHSIRSSIPVGKYHKSNKVLSENDRQEKEVRRLSLFSKL